MLYHSATREAPVDHCSVLKMKDILAPATVWMELEDFRSVKEAATEDRNTAELRSSGARWAPLSVLTDRSSGRAEAGRRGGGTVLSDGDRVSASQGEKVLETDDSDGSTVTCMYLMPQSWIF